jgi:beta-1,3-galactosyltransferase
MVNSLRIKGDLQTSSVIVNGLPISDDVSLIPDLKVIRAPKLPKKATLLIGVFSSNSNFVRRMAVRRTWMQYPEVRNGTVVVRFFVGLVSSSIFLHEGLNRCTYGSFTNL